MPIECGNVCGQGEQVVMISVYDILEKVLKRAREDPELRSRLLQTREAERPVQSFCRICGEYGYEISAMDLVMAGEEAYAAMRRSTNGGGENSPLLVGEDDDYELFLTELDRMNSEGI